MLNKNLLLTKYNNNHLLYINDFMEINVPLDEFEKGKDSLYVLFYNNDSFCINYNTKLLNKFVNKNITIYLIDGNNKKILNNLLKQKSEEYKFNYIKLPENLFFINNNKIYSLMINLNFIFNNIIKYLNPSKFCIMLQECFIVNDNFNKKFFNMNNKLLYGREISNNANNKWHLLPDIIMFNKDIFKEQFTYFSFKWREHGLGFTGDSYETLYNKLCKFDYDIFVHCINYNYESLYKSKLNFYEIYDNFLIKKTSYYDELKYIKNKKNKYFVNLLNKFL